MTEIDTTLLVETIDDIRREVSERRRQGAAIGVVPTMGALHAGHLSLIERARDECDCVVVTIFVNPKQFGPHEDYQQYPRPFADDLAACSRLGVDLVFHPAVDAIYPPGSDTFVVVEGLSHILEGKFRPTHFRGVATVVLKLFHIVRPDLAYFGQKDYQQQVLVRQMCRDLDLDVDVRVCPTVREPDGLALSSRNRYLSPGERQSAARLFASLQLARERLTAGETDVESVRRAMREHLEAAPEVAVDYATVAHPETLEELRRPLRKMVALVAARVAKTRLIDNLVIEVEEFGEGVFGG